MTELKITAPEPEDGSEQVSNDAMQLVAIATFNGLCRVIAALGDNGLLTPGQLDNIEDAMTTPLDDPDWRDYDTIAGMRDVVGQVLSRAVKHSHEHLDQSDEDEED